MQRSGWSSMVTNRMGETLSSSELREQYLKDLSVTASLVRRWGWTPKIAARFDSVYCLYIQCGECGMQRLCPRPSLQGILKGIELEKEVTKKA